MTRGACALAPRRRVPSCRVPGALSPKQPGTAVTTVPDRARMRSTAEQPVQERCRAVDVLVVDVEVGDGPDPLWASQLQKQSVTGRRGGELARGPAGVRQVKDNHVRLDRVDVDGGGGDIRNPASQAPRTFMIISQPLHMVVQRVAASRGNYAGLPHPTTEPPAQDPGGSRAGR